MANAGIVTGNQFTEELKGKIYTVRGMQVMLDSDLAELYEVPTKVFNQSVKRNIGRFPDNFRFQLSTSEYDSLRSQFVTLKNLRGQHRKYIPYVFTEQGVGMLSGVLNSEKAVSVSISIINTFVKMRHFIQSNGNLFTRVEQIEKRQIKYELITDTKFTEVFDALGTNDIPKQGIFYNGQMYDAYAFTSDLIRTAKKSIVLLDNFVDDTVLTILSKRQENVSASIYTKNIPKQLKLDLEKHNEQYSEISVTKFSDSHDRFLIIDEKEVYHIGASLKDLGKTWFAFSRFDKGAVEMLGRL
ncbi:MAG: ORF6N domain-containing protein [Colwellia sp.]